MTTTDLTPVEIEAVKVLIAHQRRDIGSCICGWGVHAGNLGQSHALHIWRELQRAVLPQYAARVREEAAKTLRACAAGRREYIRNAPDHAAVDLEHEAMLLDDAARVAEGDIGPLYGWLPSWRWTPEMHAALDCTHATAPIEEDQHADH